MSKFRLSLRIAAAMILVAATGISHAQTAALRGRAVVKATVVTGGPALITTVAGLSNNDGAPATSAAIAAPRNLAFDGAGNMYIAEYQTSLIRRVDAKTGIITTVAGTGQTKYDGLGGPATRMSLRLPNDVAADADGNVYFTYVSKTYKLDLSGVVTVVADGGPTYIFLDDKGGLYQSYGSDIYVTDVKTGAARLVAGDGRSPAGFSGDGGPATQAKISAADMYVDNAGNLYFAETNNHRVRKVDAKTGIITTVAGNGQSGFSGDGGPATSASLNGPRAVYVDAAGNVYISDTGNARVRKVDASGIITTFAGGGTLGPALADGGPATQAQVAGPIGILGDRSGNIYIANTGNDRIRKVDPSGIITTVAGGGFFGEGGPASRAYLTPRDIYVDGAGNIYIADTANNRVRKVDANGVITTVAGTGIPSFSGDGGSAASANMIPNSVFTDALGNLYVGGDGRVRRVDANTGFISTVAGTGMGTFSGDGGLATGAGLSVSDFVLDGAGNLFIADNANHRVRKVDAKTGVISTVAGDGTAGFSGDGGPATAARLNNPTWVFVDASGNLYLSDQNNNRVRKVDAKTGIITTVAGDGTAGFSGDGGPATAARLNGPSGLFVDNAGNLYLTDRNNNRIRKVNAAGIISTVTGNAQVGFLGDGEEPIGASLFAPSTVFLDGAGNLYIADSDGNHRVRKVAAPSVKDVAVAFSRSVSGRAADYRWKGTTDAGGLAQIEIVADPPKVGLANASGYYSARVTDATGAVVGTWTSIPINGGKEITLSLPIGGLANVLAVRSLETSGSLSLYANSPNPFNPATQIAYELPEAGEVRLVVYNALGQEVRALVQGRQEAGYYRVTWDGRDAAGRPVSSGLYFYRLMGSGFVETRKMMLLK